MYSSSVVRSSTIEMSAIKVHQSYDVGRYSAAVGLRGGIWRSREEEGDVHKQC